MKSRPHRRIFTGLRNCGSFVLGEGNRGPKAPLSCHSCNDIGRLILYDSLRRFIVQRSVWEAIRHIMMTIVWIPLETHTFWASCLVRIQLRFSQLCAWRRWPIMSRRCKLEDSCVLGLTYHPILSNNLCRLMFRT